MDYSKTLNLPKTDFPMKANLPQREPELLKKWEQGKLYQEIRKKSKGKKTFILHDGPPYANGPIHIGHALNKILKDIIVKFKTMEGYDSPYLPGWDCHGLPIEHQLFKELKTHKSKVACGDFRKKAHQYAMKYVGIQREEFKRLGVFGDWGHPYLTLTPEYEYWILKSLAALNQKGYIYRGLKPVNWCFECETALAEAEVEYEDHTSPSLYVKFKVTNPECVWTRPSGKDVFLLIWTTTPWTLLANVAVAVNPLFTYHALDVGNEILIIEKNLAPSLLAKVGIGEFHIFNKFVGDQMTGIRYAHPFGILDNCKVVTADYVTREDGTGLVHTAPGHGQEDYETGLVHGLEVVMPVDEKGVFTQEAQPFAGEHVFKANEKIIKHLEGRRMLFHKEDVTHSYPHCWRCQNPIIFRATEQWFLKIDHENLRERLKEAIKTQVQWIPPSGQERILGMVVGRPDWCLSRQRYWGVPIPAVICQGCGGKHRLFTEVIESFAEIVRDQGSDSWFQKDLREILPQGFVCPQCRQNQFAKTYDILDVWFDSGVSWQAVVKSLFNLKSPADLYLEGSDQHRGWFQSSLIPSVAIDGRAPFAGVLTHGFVVDGQGRKMSKSLGNVISPQDLIQSHGAEILRLWVAASDYPEDIRISPEIVERLVDAYRKIRNTFRFILGNLNGFDPAKDLLRYEDLMDIDQWALNRLSQLGEEVSEGYKTYHFAKAYKLIYSFCNEDLSSIYLDILKDRLYTFAAQSPERRSARTVLFYILDGLVRLVAPILSFTAEEVFERMPKGPALKTIKSVHLLDWPLCPEAWNAPGALEKLRRLLELRPHILKALEAKRRLGEIGGSLEAKVVFLTKSDREFEYFKERKDILATLLIVSQVEVQKGDTPFPAIAPEFSEIGIQIDLADGPKCSRCWNYSPSVGQNKEHPSLCQRCVLVISREIPHAAKES